MSVVPLLAPKRDLDRSDILPMDRYAAIRKDSRARMTEIKRNRRVSVGPHATFYFECYATMWHQVHEMLWIEKGGDEQLGDELRAYNPLIPKGRELVATVMFEIEDPVRRNRVLSTLGGVEGFMFIEVSGHKVRGRPEGDVERTKSDGKTSSVHFMHFDFTPDVIAKFRSPGAKVSVGIEHPNYGHIALIADPVREALGSDFEA